MNADKPADTPIASLAGDRFGFVEFKLKCVFCNAEDQNQSEYMGNTWDHTWTCPNCGIKYTLGKDGTRCMHFGIDRSYEKTGEWEREGHLYLEENQNQCSLCEKPLAFQEVQRIKIIMKLGEKTGAMTIPICPECKEKKAWIQPVIPKKTQLPPHLRRTR